MDAKSLCWNKHGNFLSFTKPYSTYSPTESYPLNSVYQSSVKHFVYEYSKSDELTNNIMSIARYCCFGL